MFDLNLALRRWRTGVIRALVLGATLWASSSMAGYVTPDPTEEQPPSEDPPCHNKCCGFGGFGGGGGGGGGGSSGPGAGPGFGDGTAGDPVLLWDGSERLSELDLVAKSTFPIRVIRRYNSGSTYDSNLGYGWAFAHDRALFEYPDDSVVIRSGCGIRSRFTKNAGAYQTPIDRTQGQLTANGDGSYEFRYYDGTRDMFDADGRLVREYDVNGFSHEFIYDAAGKLPLTGTTPKAVEPGVPRVIAQLPRVTRIQERAADNSLTGVHVDFTYNPSTGRLQQVRSNDGRTATYTHDVLGSGTRGNLVRVDAPAGFSHVYQYNDPFDTHNLTSIQRGTRTGVMAHVNVFDAHGRVQTQTFGDDVLTFTYTDPPISFDPIRSVSRIVKNEQGQTLHTATTTYTYFPDGRIKFVVDPLGNQARYGYDVGLRRNKVEISGPGAFSAIQTRDYTYDGEARVLTEAITLDAVGANPAETVTKTYTYDQGRIASEQSTSTDPAKPGVFRTEYTYYRDALNRPLQLKEIKRRLSDTEAVVTTHHYDSKGRLERTVLPDGIEIRQTYGSGPFPTGIDYFSPTNGLLPQLAQDLAYDADNEMATRTVASGPITTYEHDDLGRLTTTTNALGQKTVYTYQDYLLTQTETGRTTADGEGRITRYVFDGRGRRTATERKSEGGQFPVFETLVHDSVGHVIKRKDALDRTTQYTYDQTGQLVIVTDPLNHATTYAYDAAGNRTGTTDALGRQTLSTYDDLNRLIGTEQKGVTPSVVTTFGYDAAGNLTRVTDGANQVTNYTYDNLSRRLTEIRPLGQSLSYAYDERDRLKTWTNSRGQQVRHDYHPWGPLLQSRHYADAAATTPLRTIAYTYDNRANLTAVSDDSIQAGTLWSANYDLLDRAQSTRAHYIPGAAAGIWVDQAWDRYGNLQSEGIRNASTGEVLSTSYAYDNRNRLSGATLPAGANVTITSNEADQRTNLAYPNATNQATTYLANGNVDIITLTAPGGATLERWDYAYDAVSNVDTITTTQGVYDYDYDGLDRLNVGIYPAATGLNPEMYRYDPLGNRDLRFEVGAYQYNANNQLTVSPGTTHSYDADGSLVGRVGESGLTVSAQYDATNRPTAWATETVTLSTYLDYAHEPQGRRIRVHAEKVTGINTTETTAYYLWAGDRIVAEYDVAGNRTVRYAYLPGDYSPIQQATATATTYLHSDRLQTPRRGTSTAGVVTWKGDYRSFGDGAPNTDPDGNGQAVVVKHR
ncbi:MAG TPA: DUF6531 domain-containing protein, partial [Ilumatobacteraceae bacterium]|nr:DUF6531 domain-containing protein [Ilumatobacteraceae bacterium]